MKGFYGRILIVDLTARSFQIESLSAEVREKYLGGKGLGSYLLYHYNPPGVDPLTPDNCLIFATGPVTGSLVWGSSRYGVFTKSPLTGFYTESYSGGRVPEAIAATGFDAVLIKGKSENPAILSIHPDGADFCEAGDIWGLDTYASEDAIRQRFDRRGGSFKKSGAVVIGPAGENLVRFAVIENDYWRSAGRTGVGAVMGSKNLKGLHFQGDQRRAVIDPSGLREYSKQFAALNKDSAPARAYKTMGTPQMVKVMNQANAFPTRYWSEGRYEEWEKIGADSLHEKLQVTPHACLKCFMACGRLSTVKEGRHAGLRIEGPEYETIYAFGGLCLINRIEEIAYLNDICDRLGLDTISAGNLCAFTMEAAERGKIDYKIRYGDAEAVAKLLRMIAAREDIGETLAQGIRFAAEEWDLEDIAVHVKGLEPAGYDPRVLKGMGLAYAVSDRGACHLRTTFYKPELSGLISPETIEGKAKLLIEFEDRLNIFDMLILCRFYRDFYSWEQLEQVIGLITGLEADQEALQAKASALANLVRRFNIREGLTSQNDRLPQYLHQRMGKTGQAVTEGEISYMLQEYYQLRGWDKNGFPPRE